MSLTRPKKKTIRDAYASLARVTDPSAAAILAEVADDADDACHAFFVCTHGTDDGGAPAVHILLEPRPVGSIIDADVFAWTTDIVDGEMPPAVKLPPEWLLPGQPLSIPLIAHFDRAADLLEIGVALVPASDAAIVPSPKTAKNTQNRRCREPCGSHRA